MAEEKKSESKQLKEKLFASIADERRRPDRL